jgi:hypothetical protein
MSALSRSNAGMVQFGVAYLAGTHLQGTQTNLPVRSKENGSHAYICSSERHTLLAGSRVPPLRAFVNIAFPRFSHDGPQHCCDTGDLRRRRPSDLRRPPSQRFGLGQASIYRDVRMGNLGGMKAMVVACCPTICKDNWGCWSKWELSESVRGRVGWRPEGGGLVEDLLTSFSLKTPPRLRCRGEVGSDYTHACRICREYKPERMQRGLGK